MKKTIFSLLISTGLLLFSNGCADLEVVNPNNPSTEALVSSSEDIKGLTAGAYASLYSIFGDGVNAYYCNTNMEFTGDYITMTNNVRAWWSQFKIEPRVQFNNTLAFTDLNVIGRPFKQLHAAISSANDVINAIENEGIQVGVGGGDTQMVLAAAYFCKAMAQGYLANTFDRAYLVNPGSDASITPQLVSYKEILTAATQNFDRVIEIASANEFTLDERFINTPNPYSNVQLAQLARTYAANFIVQNARNRTENAQTDWAKVLAYTEGGMQADYIITLDGANWRNGLQEIAGLNWYWRTDHRIIRLMDPAYPKRFPVDANSYPPATSADKRLDLYFFYETGLGFFRTDRGPQLRSHYRFKRYDALLATGIGPATFLYAYTNNMLRAEALVMTGNVAGAIDILNAGNRVTVGGLPPLATDLSQEQVLEIVFAERDIELTLSDFGIHFKDMRRRDALQRGTILHFPVPADELATVSQTLYSYGGVNNGDGVNTADGSNSWLNP